MNTSVVIWPKESRALAVLLHESHNVVLGTVAQRPQAQRNQGARRENADKAHDDE